MRQSVILSRKHTVQLNLLCTFTLSISAENKVHFQNISKYISVLREVFTKLHHDSEITYTCILEIERVG